MQRVSGKRLAVPSLDLASRKKLALDAPGNTKTTINYGNKFRKGIQHQTYSLTDDQGKIHIFNDVDEYDHYMDQRDPARQRVVYHDGVRNGIRNGVGSRNSVANSANYRVAAPVFNPPGAVVNGVAVAAAPPAAIPVQHQVQPPNVAAPPDYGQFNYMDRFGAAPYVPVPAAQAAAFDNNWAHYRRPGQIEEVNDHEAARMGIDAFRARVADQSDRMFGNFFGPEIEQGADDEQAAQAAQAGVRAENPGAAPANVRQVAEEAMAAIDRMDEVRDRAQRAQQIQRPIDYQRENPFAMVRAADTPKGWLLDAPQGWMAKLKHVGYRDAFSPQADEIIRRSRSSPSSMVASQHNSYVFDRIKLNPDHAGYMFKGLDDQLVERFMDSVFVIPSQGALEITLRNNPEARSALVQREAALGTEVANALYVVKEGVRAQLQKGDELDTHAQADYERTYTRLNPAGKNIYQLLESYQECEKSIVDTFGEMGGIAPASSMAAIARHFIDQQVNNKPLEPAYKVFMSSVLSEPQKLVLGVVSAMTVRMADIQQQLYTMARSTATHASDAEKLKVATDLTSMRARHVAAINASLGKVASQRERLPDTGPAADAARIAAMHREAIPHALNVDGRAKMDKKKENWALTMARAIMPTQLGIAAAAGEVANQAMRFGQVAMGQTTYYDEEDDPTTYPRRFFSGVATAVAGKILGLGPGDRVVATTLLPGMKYGANAMAHMHTEHNISVGAASMAGVVAGNVLLRKMLPTAAEAATDRETRQGIKTGKIAHGTSMVQTVVSGASTIGAAVAAASIFDPKFTINMGPTLNFAPSLNIDPTLNLNVGSILGISGGLDFGSVISSIAQGVGSLTGRPFTLFPGAGAYVGDPIPKA